MLDFSTSFGKSSVATEQISRLLTCLTLGSEEYNGQYFFRKVTSDARKCLNLMLPLAVLGAGEIKPRRVFLEKVNVFDGRTNRAIYREPLIERAIDFHKKLVQR